MMRPNCIVERDYIGLVPEKFLKEKGMIYVSHESKIVATISKEGEQIKVETFLRDVTFRDFAEAIEFVAEATRKR